MKTAGMVLGIVGGALVIICALFFSLMIWSFAGIGFDGLELVLFIGIGGLMCGGLGIAGGVIIRKNNVLAGVFFIIAAVISLFFFIISAICFILASIFAFIRERPPLALVPCGAYYPYPPHYPYYYAPYGYPYYAPYYPPYPAPNEPPSGAPSTGSDTATPPQPQG